MPTATFSIRVRQRKATIRTSSPRPWRSRASSSSAPVGSDGPFGEHAELPKNLGEDGRKKPHKPSAKAKKSPSQLDKASDRKAARAYERERQRRERQEVKEEAARQKERARRQEAVDKAQAALDTAEEGHVKHVAALRSQIKALEGTGRGVELGRGSEAAEGGRAAGAGLRGSGQECVNHHDSLQKNFARTS